MKYLESLRRLPGAIAAGASDNVPLEQGVSIGSIDIKGYGRPKSLIDAQSVTPGYFQALGANLLAARLFSEHDMAKTHGAFIVNEAFVKAFLHGRDPIGQQVRMGPSIAANKWSVMVGVVANIKNMKLEEEPRPEFFRLCQAWFGAPNMRYAIRSKIPAEALIPAARKALHDLDPALALSDIRTMRQRMSEVNAKRRFQTVLLTTFAALAVFLAMIGIYGVMAYSVKQRTSEIGVRMALGASQSQVLQMILRQGIRVVPLGLAAGIGAGLLLTRVIRASLYGIPPNDPVTFVMIPLLVLAVACCACLLPALDGSRVDPAIAIRNE